MLGLGRLCWVGRSGSTQWNNPTNLTDPTGFFADDGNAKTKPQEETCDKACQLQRKYDLRTLCMGATTQCSSSSNENAQSGTKDNKNIQPKKADATKSGDFKNFLGEVKFGESLKQFGLRLVDDFVKNNTSEEYSDRIQFTWLAKKLDGVFEKPDSTSANGVVATVGVAAAGMLTPGGARAKMAEELSAGAKFLEGTTLHPRVLKQLESGDRHAFPVLIDEIAKQHGTVVTTLDSRGKPVQMLTVKGEVNGEKGTFEYIKNAANEIYHRFFDNRKP